MPRARFILDPSAGLHGGSRRNPWRRNCRRGLIDRNHIAFADLTADVQRDLLSRSHARSKLEHIAVVARDRHFAKRYVPAVIDYGNMRSARTEHERGRRYLQQVVI